MAVLGDFFLLLSRNAKAMIAVVAGFVLLTLSRDLITPLGVIAGMAGVAMIVASTSAEVFSYLQRGFSPGASRTPSLDAGVTARVSRIEESITELKDNLTPNSRISSEILSENEKNDIKEKIFNHVIQREVKDYLFEVSERFVDEHMQGYADALRGRYGGIISALEQEISNLGRRANVNLVMGAAITALGLTILGYFVLYAPHPTFSDHFEAAVYFGTRLTLVVFIEVFAYFFLRLYRYSLFEIKYFQNESTNARFRIVGLEASIQNGSKAVVEKICLELAKTERNFILKKGETTLALRKDEIEQIGDSNVAKLIEHLLNSKQQSRANLSD